MKRIIAIILAAALLAALAGCSSGGSEPEPAPEPAPAPESTAAPAPAAPETEAPETEPAPETTLPPETEQVPETTAPPTTEAPETEPAPTRSPEEALAACRAEIRDRGAICGVIYLGYAGLEAPAYADDPSAWEAFLQGCGYAEEYSFLRELPPERLIEAGGDEIYCVIPLEDNLALSVRRAEFNEDTYQLLGTDEVLFEQTDADPLVIRCNVSDIIPNTQLTVMGAKNSLIWEPSVSMENGEVWIPDNMPMCDLTDYDWERQP